MRFVFAIALLFAAHMAFADSGVLHGNGTVVYDGSTLKSDLQNGKLVATNEAWCGVLCVTNATLSGLPPEWVANPNSTFRLTGCEGYFAGGVCSGTLELKDDLETMAFTVTSGISRETSFARLTGDGTFYATAASVRQKYVFLDPSQFRGTITLVNSSVQKYRVVLGNYADDPSNGTITVANSTCTTIADGRTWSASTSYIYGTLAFVGTGSLHGDAVAYSGSTLSLSNSESAQPIDGRLSLISGSSIHLPASAKFPYKVATSIVMDGDVSLYVGTEEFTGDWIICDGSICPIASRSVILPSDASSVNWRDLEWNGAEDHTNNLALASTITVQESIRLNLGNVTTRKVTFDVAEGKTLSLVGYLTADEVAINGRGTVACNTKYVLTAILTGEGTLCYESSAPTFGEGYIVATNDAWSGTLWLKGVENTTLNPAVVASANSRLGLSGFSGTFLVGNCAGSLALIDGENEIKAFTVTNGRSGTTTFAHLVGSGTMRVMAYAANQTYAFTDSSDFSGTIDVDPSESNHMRVKLLDRVYNIYSDAGGDAVDLSLATFKTEAQLKAAGLDFGDGGTILDALSLECSNGLFAWQNMILGIAPNACENVKPYVAPVQNSMPDKLSFRLGNCNATDVFNDITAKYQVYEVDPSGSPIEGSGALNSGDPAFIDDEVSIDLAGSTSVRYFRIKIVFE